MHDIHLLAHVQQQRRRIKIAPARHRFPAKGDACALGDRFCHLLLNARQRGGVNQRSHCDIVARRRIAKLHRLQRFAQTVNEAIVNAFLHVHALDAVAHLPAINDPRIHHRLNRQLQIRIVHHDSGRFPAQLQTHFSDVFRRRGHNLLARGNAAGHADHRHFRIACQLLAYGFSAAQHQVKDPFWQTDIMDDLRKSDGVIRRKFTRFNDDGIAGNQRRRQLTGNQEERKIPRQDAGRHTQRALKYQNVLPRAVALHNFTFITARPLGHIIKIIGGKRDLHRRQLLDFSALSDDQRGDLFRTFADTGGDFAQPSRALNRRQGLPARLRALGGENRAPRILPAAVGDPRKQRFRCRVDHINPRITAAGFKLAVNIHRVLNGCCHGLLLRIIVFNR